MQKAPKRTKMIMVMPKKVEIRPGYKEGVRMKKENKRLWR